MKNYSLLFIIAFLFFSVQLIFAQDSTIELDAPDSLFKKTFIVPFEPDLYASDMDLEIGRNNQLSQPKIVEKFRINFDRVLENTVQLKNETQSILHDETSANENELIEIYSGITFEYTPIKRNVSRKDKLIAKVVSPKNAPQKEAGLKNGEIYTVRDTIERYMKTVLVDSLLLEKLNAKNKSENFLFVNQFELKNSFEDVLQMQNDTYERELRIHYSILNIKGVELVGGIAKCRFSNKIVNINQIIAASFPCAAKQIAESLTNYERSLIPKKK
jgi:hypothetical protein